MIVFYSKPKLFKNGFALGFIETLNTIKTSLLKEKVVGQKVGNQSQLLKVHSYHIKYPKTRQWP